MGNRSERRRRETDAPDPVSEWQEEARWSAYTGHIRWLSRNRGNGRWSGRIQMPPAGAWLGIAVVVAGVLAVLWTVGWLLAKIFP